MAKPKIPKNKQKKIAKERIVTLFDQAQKQHKENQSLANRYVFLARKLAMKLRLSIPLIQKRQYCKHCYTYLVPSKNVRIRISRGKVVTLCLSCKKFQRIPYKKQQKEKRKKRITQKINQRNK
ncbi:ribonuclease P [archaeon]|jgi:ribonuclease P protein subunit RPR2|nr:ribonuclease P [archaeon]MBT6762172.1 ribonuclease P [archaeon]